MAHPFCPEYKHITVPKKTNEEVEDIHETILIDFQGTYTIISHKTHLPSLFQLFQDIRSVAHEIIVESPEGTLFLTPLHTQEPVIRPKGTITELASFELKHVKTTSPPQTIPLKELFTYNNEVSHKTIQTTCEALSEKKLQGASSITLIGNIPTAPAIFIALLLCGNTELWYKETSDAEAIRI